MARQNRNSGSGNGSPQAGRAYGGEVTWVNYTLTQEHKIALASLIEKRPEQLQAEMQTAAQEGYRWSIGWDDYAQCWSVTMFTRDKASVNAGLMMSSRSKDWYKAMLMCLYKHAIVFEHRWVIDPDPERDWEG